MEKTLEHLVFNDKGQCLLEIFVPAEAFLALLDEAFEAEKPSLEGKYDTRAQAEAALGSDAFYPAAAQLACIRAADEVIAEEKLDVVGYPEITKCGTEPHGLRFTAVCDPRPRVTLGEYRGIDPRLPRPQVTEEEVDEMLKSFALRAAEDVDLPRPAQAGDLVYVDFTGTVGGRPFDGGSAEDYALRLGGRTFLPELEAGMTGMSAGEEKDIPLVFPDNYAAGLAGKAAVFHVEMKRVCRRDVPAVDERFARTYFETDLASLRTSVKESMLADKREQHRVTREEAALAMAAQRMQVELPESMIRREMDLLTGDLARRLEQNGGSLEEYYRGAGMEEDDFWETARRTAESRLREELLLRAVQEKEGLILGDAFRARAAADLARRFEVEEKDIYQMMTDQRMERELLRMRVLEVVLAPEAE